MKKKWLLFLLVLVVGTVLLLVLSRDPVRHSVSVTFLYYTNRDTRGWNDMYTWAWFRIENRSPFMLLCQQGTLDIERAGAWVQDTNRLGFQYDPPIIEPGQTLTVSMMPPADATQWRSSFLLTKMAIHSEKYWTRRSRFEDFMDSLRLHRIGLRSQPWRGNNPKPTVITSETMGL
jgi:hypothetical protein